MLWYSLEAPRRSASNEYHNIRFYWEIRKISAFFGWKKRLIYCYGLYFVSFGIIEPILVILKIEHRLSRRLGARGWGGQAYVASQTTVLHMKRFNHTESPIFVILCVLCFQILFDFYWHLSVSLICQSLPVKQVHVPGSDYTSMHRAWASKTDQV